jgi:hypothetical protein
MDKETPRWVEIVREKVASLQYGVVQIVVHNSKVTQIDRTERIRFENSHGTEGAAKAQKFNRPDILEAP